MIKGTVKMAERDTLTSTTTEGETKHQELILSKGKKKGREKFHIASREKFLCDDVIYASNILTWEMDYFLHTNYEVQKATSYRKEPSVEHLVQEAFQFLYPSGVPKFYKHKYGSGTPWNIIAPKMCEDFFAESKEHQWFRDNFVRDYAKDEGCPLISIFPKNVNESIKSNWKKITYNNDPEFERSMTLAGRIHKVMQYIVIDENRSSTEDREKQEKHEKIKGMMSEVMSYLKIPILYNGESKLDFLYNLIIPDRKKEQPDVQFKVRPDITLCTKTFPDEEAIPFCTVEIYAPYEMKLLQRISASEESSSCSEEQSGTSDIDFKMKSLSITQDINKSEKTSSSDNRKHPYFEKQDNPDKFKNSNEDEVRKKTSNLKLYKDKSIQKCDSFSVYFDTELQEKSRENVRKNTPFSSPKFRDSDAGIQKLASQLVMEMYGLLVCRATNFEKAQHNYKKIKLEEETKQQRVGIGLFVMNDRIYMSQICHELYFLFQPAIKGHTRPEVENGPSVRFADWFFSFKRPADRLGFMVFLHHYKNIMMSKFALEIWD